MAILILDGTTSTSEVSNFSGVQIKNNRNNKGFAPYQVDGVFDVTASMTLTPGRAGIITLTSGSAMTVVLPLAAGAIGASFLFRNSSAVAHVITASQEAVGSKTIVPMSGTTGNRVTMPATTAASVELKSDGVNWLVVTATSIPTIAGA